MANQSKNKILIVDDEFFVRKIFGELFKKRGFDVMLATNGDEGLDMIRNNKPDLVVLDILMPGRDGLEVLRQLKKEKIIEKLPVIVLSAFSGPQYVDAAIELGAKAYLGKADYQIDEILSKIDELLGKSKKA